MMNPEKLSTRQLSTILPITTEINEISFTFESDSFNRTSIYIFNFLYVLCAVATALLFVIYEI